MGRFDRLFNPFNPLNRLLSSELVSWLTAGLAVFIICVEIALVIAILYVVLHVKRILLLGG